MGGLPSEYRVLTRNIDSASGHKTTEVLFRPKTGRTHQLRVHSQSIGHPIIGCDLYNAIVDGVDTQALSKRLCLHATSLAFIHPVSKQELKFECPSSY